MVTGGNDGIGLGMCLNLARQGFNICIVSRSEEKIKKALEDIKEAVKDVNPNIKTLSIVADFSKMYTI